MKRRPRFFITSPQCEAEPPNRRNDPGASPFADEWGTSRTPSQQAATGLHIRGHEPPVGTSRSRGVVSALGSGDASTDDLGGPAVGGFHHVRVRLQGQGRTRVPSLPATVRTSTPPANITVAAKWRR